VPSGWPRGVHVTWQTPTTVSSHTTPHAVRQVTVETDRTAASPSLVSGFGGSKTARALLLALPCGVILLNVIVWIIAVSRSGFWADDFLWVTHFARSLGDLSDYHFNVGKYVINIFWAVGTEAFGAGSVVPFLLLNSIVLATGLVAWLWAGVDVRWGSIGAWWIGGLFIATAAWLPTALWSSNITHSTGFLALGAGILAHKRAMSARTVISSVCWSVVGGAAWTFAVASNLLYIGLIVLAAYCSLHQVARLRILGMQPRRAAAAVGSWNLLLPLVYFAAIGYPGTTSSAPYAVTGLRFVYDNLRFYRFTLAPTDLLMAVYAAALAGALAGAIAAIRRSGDFFALAVLGAAGATALPALVQSQQRDIHYVAMPVLLVFSALFAGARPIFLGASRRTRGAATVLGAAALLLLFQQGAELRAYFVRSPYGSGLASFRSEVASLMPEGGAVCVDMNLDLPHQTLLIADMSGPNGFLVPPIDAGQVYLLAPGDRCPAAGPATSINVSLDARGEFIASS
jgi:hypothetical protein